MGRAAPIIAICALFFSIRTLAVGESGMYQYSVALTNFISPETGKAPTAWLWLPDGCRQVRAVMVAQQNMTEEALFRMPSFQERLKEMSVALLWIAPPFSEKWDPATPCQTIFEDMLAAISYQSGHAEIATAPVIPFGHSAQATFPWNFAAWNPGRTLCIISFHGDAPRTNLCGFGTGNVEWGRQRNIDGIPGLMVEGEYEWWEARVRPALAFRIMYPESCVSFLCDTGRGHFDCGERTADYIALFIRKAMEQRLNADGTLRKVDPRDGWLVPRYVTDLPENDGDGETWPVIGDVRQASAAPYASYEGDRHDAFWYFDEEMAHLTEERHGESRGKATQYVGVEYGGDLVPFDASLQGYMRLELSELRVGDVFTLRAVYTDESRAVPSDLHSSAAPRMEVISGPVEKLDDTTFRVREYEAGRDNPRRSFSIWLVAVGDGDRRYRGCVQPVNVRIGRF